MDELHASQECIDKCRECAEICRGNADNLEDVTGMEECRRLCLECAVICEKIISSETHSAELFMECAEKCRACANECDMHDDSYCRMCAEVCRACEEECTATYE